MYTFPKTIRDGSIPNGGVQEQLLVPVFGEEVRAAEVVHERYTGSNGPIIPTFDMELDHPRAGLVVIDPLVNTLGSAGEVGHPQGQDRSEHKTVQNLVRLFKASKRAGISVAILLTSAASKDRSSGFIPELVRYIDDDHTIICQPNKFYSPLPQASSIGLQLRRQRVGQIIFAGIIGNFGIEHYLRDFLEQGFDVAVVCDAIDGCKRYESMGHLLVLARAFWTTEETVKKLN